ncbi:hypothetical protein P3G55_20050 [Leptospira sp. 96542]|nr:hypothetical protein [Leptospira sp. 96542]
MLYFNYETIGFPLVFEWGDLVFSWKLDQNGENPVEIGRDFQGVLLEPSDLVNVYNAISDSIELVDRRIRNLLEDPIPETTILDGSRFELSQFFEVFTEDQIDGLTQRLSLFTNALNEKISDITSNVDAGLFFDKSNPQHPVIIGNKPLWEEIRNKPSEYSPISHNHSITQVSGLQTALDTKINTSQKGVSLGVASLDASGKIPASQIPVFDPALQIVNTISERNALNPTANLPVYVKDASSDPTVLTGGAFYLWEVATSSWIKLSEMESMDIIQSWENITEKPFTFAPSAHGHGIDEISGLQTALDSKRALGNIPGNEITQDANHRLVTDSEKTLWNNTIHNAGDLNGSVSFAGFNANRTYKARLTGNTAFTEISGGVEGNVYVMVFTQDATGGRTITLPSNIKIPTGETSDLGANKKSILTMYCDGAEYLGSWKKGW